MFFFPIHNHNTSPRSFCASPVSSVGFWLTWSASTVDPCLKGCVIQAAKEIGCWNEGDIPGSIKCGCGDKRGEATSHGVACLQGKCPEQIGGAWGLFDKMCKEGVTGNIN